MAEGNNRLHTLKLAAERIGSMQIGVYAANACYFLVLSVFPILLILLGLVAYLPYSARDLLEFLGSFIPEALMGVVETLIVSVYYNSSGAILSVSAVTALWSASRGVFGLITGLNHIYGVREDRGYFYTRLISVLYTFVMLILILLTLVMQVFGPTILGWFVWGDGPLTRLLMRILDWNHLWMLLIQIMVFAALYMVLPNRRNHFWDSLPGAAVAAVGWQGFTGAFSFYVENVGGGSCVYGSVYLVALAMLWLYFCISILLFGGGLNRLIQQWQKK